MGRLPRDKALDRAWSERDRAIGVAKDLLRLVRELERNHPEVLRIQQHRIDNAQARLAPLVGAERTEHKETDPCPPTGLPRVYLPITE